MEEKNFETEEVLEQTPSEIPEELYVFLEKDYEVFDKLDGVICDLDNDIVSLNAEREDSEREFEERLNTFKEQLEKEKADRFDEYAQREQSILEHKDEIEKLRLDQQGKQGAYIENLINIASDYNAKINSIEEAIKACEDNESLNHALDEEYNKKANTLNNEYGVRIEELNGVLEAIGEKVEEPALEEAQPEEENHFDSEEQPYEDEEKEENPSIDFPSESGFNLYDEDYDTEVVSHEPREDVINEIYSSEDVMEGHVFPYLRSLK